ncbi:MAG: undecaprenyldiphospho-muramoylpentapeptide beta-N-acetylglucosaminyltransferase [bacterium]|nr:undecaprenyldiphospho-muramoylpentapeptide beta-N-acetylglucosaminyltransferase [bacterium]
MMKRIKIIFAAGTTGGHLYPALAVADCIKIRVKNPEILFLISRHCSSDKIKKTGFQTAAIFGIGWNRNKPFSIIPCFAEAFLGLIQSFIIILKFKPDLVVGMGSYLSISPVIAAYLMRIPTLIHEQNIVPGSTNKLLANIATEVDVAFDETKKYLSCKRRIVAVGNPIRNDILKAVDKRHNLVSKKKKTILVFGGSQGAHQINIVSQDTFINIKEHLKHWHIIHITGEKDYKLVLDKYKKADLDVKVMPFTEHIGDIYTISDLVISRAGAMTITEISLFGIPAILIPYPHAAANHQFYNGKLLSDNGAGIIIEEKNLCVVTLSERILDLIKNEYKLEQMALSSRKLGRLHINSTEKIFEIIRNYI